MNIGTLVVVIVELLHQTFALRLPRRTRDQRARKQTSILGLESSGKNTSARFWRNRIGRRCADYTEKDPPFCLQFSEWKVMDGSFWNCCVEEQASRPTNRHDRFNHLLGWEIVNRSSRKSWKLARFPVSLLFSFHSWKFWTDAFGFIQNTINIRDFENFENNMINSED